MSWIARLHLARVHYVDQEGTKDTVAIFFPSAASIPGLLAALAAETAYQAVSDCTVYAVSLVCSAVSSENTAATGSNLDNGVLSFNTDGEAGVTIAIPGLREDYYTEEGCFTGMQIDTTNSDITNFADIIIANGVCTPNEQAATTLCSGHRAMIWSVPTRRSG
jgi:hypothetical protein